MKVYDFKVKNANGNLVDLKEYKGKVLLIVNSATRCGFTPQYNELQKIYDEYKDKGFVILDFPCNQFAHQAPGTEEEIVEFCTRKYNVSFPIFAKIEVNGENEDPLFTFLKQKQPFKGVDGKFFRNTTMKILGKISKSSKDQSDIKWNFTKFLINKNGEVVDRFEPTESLKSVKEKIESLL